MKVLFDIVHPVDVLFFRDAIESLRAASGRLGNVASDGRFKR